MLEEKLFYSIGEVSKEIGIEPYVLRFWEKEFFLLSPKKQSGNSKQRMYKLKDIELLKVIKNLLYKEGYTIKGANKFLSQNRSKRSNNIKEETLFKNEDFQQKQPQNKTVSKEFHQLLENALNEIDELEDILKE